MTPDIIITIVASLLGSSAVAIFITKLFEHSKSKAETQNINISGELKVSKAWEDYATRLQNDFNGLRDRIAELEIKVGKLNGENAKLWEENLRLRNELRKYQVENDEKLEEIKK